MPKELIYSSDLPFLQMEDGNEYPSNSDEATRFQDTGLGKWKQRGIKVGWVKDRQVEIGAAVFDPARELASDGVFMTLDRSGINRLIKALRRARDQAYGRDE